MQKITFLKYCLCAIILVAFQQENNAQLQNSNWYFGNQAGLNFNDGSQLPTSLTDSSMNAIGGSASVSDESGNLLFYTNGVTVWNKNHEIMLNGTDLNGNITISQPVVIVPNPTDANKYYVFTNTGRTRNVLSGIYYSTININGDGGLGEVVLNDKNTLLLANVSEKMTVIKNPNEDSYWLISLASGDSPGVYDTFYSYKINTIGINLANQSTFRFSYPQNDAKPSGQMKISPNKQTLAIIHNTLGNNGESNVAESLFTFSFDNATGTLSSMQSNFFLGDILSAYGLEFSPDNNLLYLTSNESAFDGLGMGRIYQLTPQDIGMGSLPLVVSNSTSPIYGLQLGIDNKIYAVNSNGTIGAIENPNILGSGSNFINPSIDLSPNSATRNFPQLVPEVFALPEIDLCETITIQKNPFKKSLKIKFDLKEIYTVELYNSFGSLAISTTYNNILNNGPLNIDTRFLLSGTYFLVIENELSQTCRKTVIKL